MNIDIRLSARKCLLLVWHEKPSNRAEINQNGRKILKRQLQGHWYYYKLLKSKTIPPSGKDGMNFRRRNLVKYKEHKESKK